MAKAKSTKAGQPPKKQPLPSKELSTPENMGIEDKPKAEPKIETLDLNLAQREELIRMFMNDLTEDKDQWSKMGPMHKGLSMEAVRFDFTYLPVQAVVHEEKAGDEVKITYEIGWIWEIPGRPTVAFKLKRMVEKSHLDRIR